MALVLMNEIQRERFWAKVDKNGPVPDSDTTLGPCWLWTGASTKGYGVFALRSSPTRNQTYSHRVAYMAFIGEIPDGHLVCHKCDTPLCVNPTHLFAGTHKDNSSDCIRKNRASKPPPNKTCIGSNHPRHKVTEADVLEMRRLRKSGCKIRILSEQFGVTGPVVSATCNGKLWKHVPLG